MKQESSTRNGRFNLHNLEQQSNLLRLVKLLKECLMTEFNALIAVESLLVRLLRDTFQFVRSKLRIRETNRRTMP
jgi:hypothetical protein